MGFEMLFSDDPTIRLAEHLRGAMPQKIPIYEQHLPEKWNPNKGVAVVVADDAPQVAESAWDRSLVRVSVHAPTYELARKFGRSIYEYLTAPFTAVGLGISRTGSTGVIAGGDSLAGGFVSTCSYSCGTSKLRGEI